MDYSITADQLTLFSFLMEMSKGQRYVMITIYRMFCSCLKKNTKMTFSRETIARKSGYSLETVKDTIAIANGNLLEIRQSKQWFGRKRGANTYILRKEFFELMHTLDNLGYLNKLLERSEYVLAGLEKDPDFLVKKLVKANEYYSRDLPMRLVNFLPGLKEFFLRIRKRNPKEKEDPRTQREKREEIPPKPKVLLTATAKILENIPIDPSTKNRFAKKFSEHALVQAKAVYEWCKDKFKVRDPAGFIYRQAQKFSQRVPLHA